MNVTEKWASLKLGELLLGLRRGAGAQAHGLFPTTFLKHIIGDHDGSGAAGI